MTLIVAHLKNFFQAVILVSFLFSSDDWDYGGYGRNNRDHVLSQPDGENARGLPYLPARTALVLSRPEAPAEEQGKKA